MSSSSPSVEKRDPAAAAQFDAASHVDLNHNVAARIQNPLAHIPKAQLLADVDAFAQENNLTDKVELLRKGALVAQNPAGFESLAELNEAEKAVLLREKTHKWDQPRALYFST
jgi:hypothetical protein